jgi:hypothetical protein
MSDAWVPGTAGPQEALVTRIVLRIEAFVEQYGKQARVEVELKDGPTAVLRSLEPEPGFGFVTLVPHHDDDENDGGVEEWIVPVTAVARITLRSVEEQERFGFSLPQTG